MSVVLQFQPTTSYLTYDTADFMSVVLQFHSTACVVLWRFGSSDLHRHEVGGVCRYGNVACRLKLNLHRQ